MGRMKCGCVAWETAGGDGEIELCDQHQAEYDAERFGEHEQDNNEDEEE